jgi:hypothetical protein
VCESHCPKWQWQPQPHQRQDALCVEFWVVVCSSCLFSCLTLFCEFALLLRFMVLIVCFSICLLTNSLYSNLQTECKTDSAWAWPTLRAIRMWHSKLWRSTHSP